MRSQFKNLVFQFLQQASGVCILRFLGVAVAVFIARRNAPDIHEQRGELLAPPLVSANRQGAQGVAVVTLAPGDEQRALGLTDFDKILSRQFQCGFHGLGAARQKIHLIQARRGMGRQVIGQGLRNLRGEKARVCVGQLVDLGVHGRQHIGMGMTQAGNSRSAACVQIGLAMLVVDVDARCADSHPW